MKPLLLLFVLIPTLLYSQEKIEGFGKLKIGKSYSEVLRDLEIDERKIQDPIKDRLDFLDMYNPKRPILLKYDTSWKKEPEASYMYIHCANAYELRLPSYKVADITVKNLELKFYNDTLYSIHINTPPREFSEAMELKYGKGKVKKETKTVNCSSAYVSSYEVKEETFRTTWDSGSDAITVEEVLMDYRDSKCKQQYLSYFRIANSRISELVRSLEKEFKERRSQEAEKERKAQLKDF